MPDVIVKEMHRLNDLRPDDPRWSLEDISGKMLVTPKSIRVKVKEDDRRQKISYDIVLVITSYPYENDNSCWELMKNLRFDERNCVLPPRVIESLFQIFHSQS